MDLNRAPLANRLHIGIFGRRNAGKSSLINAITSQPLAVVSEVPGTTTDPVYKSMELLPIGPVVIIDTAGIDDDGELGRLRVEKTRQIINKTDLAVLVMDPLVGITEYELQLLKSLKEKSIPCAVVINKADEITVESDTLQAWTRQLGEGIMMVSAKTGFGVEELKQWLVKLAPHDYDKSMIIGDLIQPGDFVVLVVPIDKAAPKGRLILPQQQTIRDIIERDAIAIISKEHELSATLKSLGKKPAMVITDSQAFLKVAADTPADIPLTSFSILFARYKGELLPLIKGINSLKRLKPTSKILIVEGCTHHRQADDIGKVKIPRWLRQVGGAELNFAWVSGVSFPENIEDYDLIVHCGGCMLNSKEMKHRIDTCVKAEVPIVNYGMLIAYIHGVLERALEPFPFAKALIDD